MHAATRPACVDSGSYRGHVVSPAAVAADSIAGAVVPRARRAAQQLRTLTRLAQLAVTLGVGSGGLIEADAALGVLPLIHLRVVAAELTAACLDHLGVAPVTLAETMASSRTPPNLYSLFCRTWRGRQYKDGTERHCKSCQSAAIAATRRLAGHAVQQAAIQCCPAHAHHGNSHINLLLTPAWQPCAQSACTYVDEFGGFTTAGPKQHARVTLV